MARTKVVSVCQYCGEEFLVFPCKLKKGRGQYCGRKCMGLANTGKGNPYYGKKHSKEIKQKMTDGWNRIKAEGYKPSNYIDGKSNKYNSHLHTTEWRNIRKAVLIRDYYTCRLCRNAKSNHVHHIVPYKIIKSHDVNNLISLCESCHELTYQRENEYISLFMDIIKENDINER